MQALTLNEKLSIAGGSIDWGDFLLGALYGADLACLYTRNPYICGGALIGHGITLFVDLD